MLVTVFARRNAAWLGKPQSERWVDPGMDSFRLVLD